MPTRSLLKTLAASAALLVWLATAATPTPAATPVTAGATSVTAEARPFLFLAWDQDVGRVLGDESDSWGPMSFAVKADGGVLVLDQANLRILDFDPTGVPLASYALPSTTFDDVAEAGGHLVLALDRLVSRTLLVLDRDGEIVTELDLAGRGIENPGLITALIPRPDGVWLEVSHRHSVRVLDAAMRPCERTVLLGRPTPDGRALIGKLDRGAGGARLLVGPRDGSAPGVEALVTGDWPVRRIVTLDATARGGVLAVLHEAVFSAVSPFRVQDERYRIVRLDADLQETGLSFSPWTLTELDQRGELRLGPDGRAWQMFFTWEGVHVVTWEGRTP